MPASNSNSSKRSAYRTFVVLGTIGSFLLFLFLLRYVDVSKLVQTWRTVDPILFIIFIALSLLGSLFRTVRYSVLLKNSPESVSSPALFCTVLVRNLCSDLLPARLGSLVYIAIARARLGVPLAIASSSFASAFLFDILAMAPLVLLAVACSTGVETVPLYVLVLGSLALLFAVALFYAALPALCRWVIPSIPENRVTLRRFFDDLRADLLSVRAQGILAHVLLLSIIIRVCKYISLYVFLCAMLLPLGVPVNQLPLALIFLGLTVAEFSASLPVSGIAGFGIYQGVWSSVFVLLGFSSEDAVTIAIGHHLFTQIWGYSLGLLALLYLLIQRKKS